MRTATNWLDNPKRFHARNKHITVDDSPRSDEPLYTIYLLLLYDHNECYGLKRNSNPNGIAYQDFLYDKNNITHNKHQKTPEIFKTRFSNWKPLSICLSAKTVILKY